MLLAFLIPWQGLLVKTEEAVWGRGASNFGPKPYTLKGRPALNPKLAMLLHPELFEHAGVQCVSQYCRAVMIMMLRA